MAHPFTPALADACARFRQRTGVEVRLIAETPPHLWSRLILSLAVMALVLLPALWISVGFHAGWLPGLGAGWSAEHASAAQINQAATISAMSLTGAACVAVLMLLGSSAKIFRAMPRFARMMVQSRAARHQLEIAGLAELTSCEAMVISLGPDLVMQPNRALARRWTDSSEASLRSVLAAHEAAVMASGKNAEAGVIALLDALEDALGSMAAPIILAAE
ncbi:MAG: hypothetical protein ACK4E3_11300 [Brevundimonas sp.]|uniref:hypothetical protein n=1 Tax=Brevundimonas sp. TaxID=1871086 RepID=UPI00391C7473